MSGTLDEPTFDIDAAADRSARNQIRANPCDWSSLPPSIRAGVRRAFGARTKAGRPIDNGSIADQLVDQGYPIDRQVVGRHRRNDCAYCKVMGVE
jgi:hypothetical protein